MDETTRLGPNASAAVTGSIDHGRFGPGTILDSRNRILGLLGRGGMGEVYRADDLRLGQPVALKFVPAALVILLGIAALGFRLATHPGSSRTALG